MLDNQVLICNSPIYLYTNEKAQKREFLQLNMQKRRRNFIKFTLFGN